MMTTAMDVADRKLTGIESEKRLPKGTLADHHEGHSPGFRPSVDHSVAVPRFGAVRLLEVALHSAVARRGCKADEVLPVPDAGASVVAAVLSEIQAGEVATETAVEK